MLEEIVSEEYDGSRADKFIKSLYSDVSFNFLQRLFRTKKIKINGKKSLASDRLQIGDIVKIFAVLSVDRNNNKTCNAKLFKQLKNMIIFENENFFAINKPIKLAVQLGSKVNFCVETLINSYPGHKCFLVHRLDKNTSGVLLIAKNQLWAKKISEMFRNSQIKKTYIAVVDGKIKKPGVIDDFIEKSFDGNKEKMHIAKKGQRAITYYKPIGMVGYNTILELNPKTGRKHQLRVHCSEELHSPILGDRKYNPNASGNMMLHAYKIFIEILNIEITAPIPKYFPKLA